MSNDLDHVRRLVAKVSLAVVATVRPDRSVHASVVNAGVLDDPFSNEPCVAFVSHADSRKLSYLRSSARATVVFRDGFDWAAVEGAVQLIGPEDVVPNCDEGELAGLLRAIFAAAGGTHEDWDEFDKVIRDEGRTAVLVKVERISGNR